MARSTVITDASWCPQSRSGGWAAWININWPDGRHQRVTKSGTFHKRPRSSNEAELWAALNGIWLAVEKGAVDLLVQTDCLSVVQHQGPKAVAEHFPSASVRWKHVKGHNLDVVNDRRTWVNEWCDREAKKQMRSQRKRSRKGTTWASRN